MSNPTTRDLPKANSTTHTKDHFVLSEYSKKQTSIQDHEDNKVNIVWCPRPDEKDSWNTPPPFPFQVYLTNGAAKLLHDPDFPVSFPCFIEWLDGIAESRHRFDVYTRLFPNVVACIEHQRREVAHRNRNGIWPRLVPRWTTEEARGYQGRILVIDRDDWREMGVVSVNFDPAAYERPERFEGWDMAGDGDVDVVEAMRISYGKALTRTLRSWWREAGGPWTEADLRRRNEGGVSPVLYPAIDPSAHYDVEHEDVHELDGTALPASTLEDDEGEGVIPRIVDTFDIKELFKAHEEFPHLRSEAYSDSFGLPVTSVWDARLSRTRPKFLVTLYLAFDMLPIHPKALFSSLNRDLVQQGAWTLDIVHNMPSLSSALDYHTRSSARRTAARSAETRSCMHLIIRKVSDNRLPDELLEYIEDMLSPPKIPDYSSRRIRPYKNVFLYLDAQSLCTGPVLVYSSPRPWWDAASFQTAHPPYGIHSSALRRLADNENLLRVVKLRYWNRVADEIHTLWSLCGPRFQLLDAADMPHISVKVLMPKTVYLRKSSIDVTPDVQFHMTLKSNRPITIYRRGRPLLSLDFWAEALEIVDLENGTARCVTPFDDKDDEFWADSWSRDRDLGFAGDDYYGEKPALLHCHPGLLPDPGSELSRGWWWPWWWQNNFRELYTKNSLHVNGHQFAMRLKPNVTIPRWTFGTVDKLEGPYNLPPIQLTMDEEVHFTVWKDEPPDKGR